VVAHAVIERTRTATTPEASAGRLTSLDGLRGIAALVVVVHHSLLTWRPLASQFLVEDPTQPTWWLVYSPLHLLWAGTEAVMVFFVLSGLVLGLPHLRRTASRRWPAYYGQRLVRLYLPVLGSLVVAAALVLAFPRTPGATTSWWFDLHAVPADMHTLLSDALLLGGVSWVNPSLWSLQYEVLFSLLLPLYVVLVRKFGDRSGWLVPPLLVTVAVGTYVGSPTLQWLPVFGVGVAMAACRERLEDLGLRISWSRWSGPLWTLLAAGSVTLLLAEWWCRGLLGETGLAALAAARAAGIAGAAAVCVLAMTCPAVVAVCEWRPVRWLGTVSFSLYLVHEPILVSVSSLVGGSRTGTVVTLVAAVVLGLAVAAVFHRLVEVPSQRLARAVGRRMRPSEDTPVEEVLAEPVIDDREGRCRSGLSSEARDARPWDDVPRVAQTVMLRRVSLPPVPAPRPRPASRLAALEDCDTSVLW
jgi:peptidoglycan/LPS O-acetylase OafA/YrhL